MIMDHRFSLLTAAPIALVWMLAGSNTRPIQTTSHAT